MFKRIDDVWTRIYIAILAIILFPLVTRLPWEYVIGAGYWIKEHASWNNELISFIGMIYFAAFFTYKIKQSRKIEQREKRISDWEDSDK